MKIILISVFICIYGSVLLPAQKTNEIEISKDIQLIHLKDSIFVHVTWHESDKYGRFPSNGMVIIKNGQAIIIDTPMDNKTTEELVTYIKDSLNVTVKKLIVGHFHDDCLGGLGYIHSIGVQSIANFMTIDKCKELHLPVPTVSFTDSLFIDLNGKMLECRYFGAGHTIDNIVVWLPQYRILFGGCLVKSIRSNGLGNLNDAVVPEWNTTIDHILEKYQDINTVVPGHGHIGGKELLSHTLNLIWNEKTGN